MTTSRTSLDDERRLAALRETRLLDTPPDEAFDRLTRLVTRTLGVPIALVTLVDEDRQFFKSCVGLPEPWASERQTPLSHSFCQHTVTTGEAFVVADAREHPELRHNLAVPDLGVVAYAGIPLVAAGGEVLGSFCAIDTKPRQWTADDLSTLDDLAQAAASEIELRLAFAEQARLEAERREADSRSQRQLRLLAESGRLLSSSLDLDATLGAIARLVVPEMADIAVIDLVEDGTMRRVAAYHADPAHQADVEATKAFPPRLDDGGPQAEAVRTGRPVTMADMRQIVATARARGETYAPIVERLDMDKLVVGPMLVGDATLGTLSLVRTSGRAAFDDDERALVEEIARRAGLAVHNARLYAESRSATRVRDDVLGVVAHDLRNPIHTIIMSSSFVLDILPPEREPMVREQVQVMRRSADRANRLIGDLVDVARMERGQLPLDCQPTDLATVAREAVEQSRLAAASRGITLTLGRVDAVPPIIADRHRMLQALENLLANALKFTPKGGVVTVSLVREGGHACLSVSDTGPGISAEHQRRLFDRFWQANRNDKRGVGLGLSIVKGIAEAHGGEVRVKSSPGEGSTFTLVLPVRES